MIPLHPHRFVQALQDAGVIGPEEKIRHLVIDVRPNHAVTIYVERYADERLLSVVTTLDGIEIRTASAVPEPERKNQVMPASGPPESPASPA